MYFYCLQAKSSCPLYPLPADSVLLFNRTPNEAYHTRIPGVQVYFPDGGQVELLLSHLLPGEGVNFQPGGRKSRFSRPNSGRSRQPRTQ